MAPSLTWWTDDSPTQSISRLSDFALMQVIEDLKKICKSVRSKEPSPHPAVQMWTRHPLALHVYGCLAAMEYHNKRGFEDDFFAVFSRPAQMMRDMEVQFALPPWSPDEDVQCSHVSAITRAKLWAPGSEMEIEGVDEFWPILWPMMTSDTEYELKVLRKDREAMERDDLSLPDDVRSRVVNL